MSEPEDRLSPHVVVDGIERENERGIAGVRSKVDGAIALPYVRLLILIVALIVVGGVSGSQSITDTVVFVLLALAVCASIVLTPALVLRLGEQPRGQRQRAIETLDFVSVAISSERLVVAAARRSGHDVDDRLRPRLREDLDVLLFHRHGLRLTDPADADAIAQVIGPEAWHLVRFDREPTPPEEGLRRDDMERLINACLRAARSPEELEASDHGATPT